MAFTSRGINNLKENSREQNRPHDRWIPPPRRLRGGGGGDSPREAAPAIISSVTVFPSSATLKINGTQQYTATIKDSNGNIRTSDLAWTTGDAAIASINADGLLQANRWAVPPSTRRMAPSRVSL